MRAGAAALLLAWAAVAVIATDADAATRKAKSKRVPPRAAAALGAGSVAGVAAGAAAASAAASPTVSPTEAAAERARQETALREMRDRLESLRREIVESDKEQADAADGLRESESAISQAGRTLNDLTLKQHALNRQLGARQSELNQLTREQGAHRQALSRLVVEQYRRKQQEPIRMLLMGGNPHDVRRHLVYLRALNKARVNSINSAQRRAERVVAIKAETQTRLGELDQVVQDSREQRLVLERERKERQRTLARIASQLEQRRQALATAQADESRLTKLVSKLTAFLEAQARAAQRPPKSAAKRGQQPPMSGRVSVPKANLPTDMARYKGRLVMPAVGELVARFGVPREAGVSGSPAWKGWFIRAPSGTPVQSVAAGRVVFADWLRGFGNLLIVDHGDGFMSLYGNNDSLLQQVGTAVEAGQSIAQAGTSGGAADSGVYFELRHNGVAFDPKRWFSR